MKSDAKKLVAMYKVINISSGFVEFIGSYTECRNYFNGEEDYIFKEEDYIFKEEDGTQTQ